KSSAPDGAAEPRHIPAPLPGRLIYWAHDPVVPSRCSLHHRLISIVPSGQAHDKLLLKSVLLHIPCFLSQLIVIETMSLIWNQDSESPLSIAYLPRIHLQTINCNMNAQSSC